MTSIQEVALIGALELDSNETRVFELDHKITSEELPLVYKLIDILHERSTQPDAIVVERSGKDCEIQISLP